MNRMASMNVAIIDDDDNVLNSFRKATLQADNVVCLSATNSIEEFLRLKVFENHKIYLFLDIYLSKSLSIHFIPQIIKDFPKIEIIMYSISEEYNHLIDAIHLGAKGYILKDFNPERLIQNFNIIRNGGAIISPVMATKLIQYLAKNEKTNKMETKLSKKDLELLNLLAEGWSYNKISEKIGITLDGVRGRIKSLYSKLNVSSKVQAINKFRNI